MAVTQIAGKQVGPLDLTTEVSGILPKANGGTGVSNGIPPTQISSITSSATPTVDVTLYELLDITALTANITSLSTSGTAGNWQRLWVSIKAAALQTVVWNTANFANSGGATWPTSVPAGKTITAAGRYNPALGKFVCFAVDAIGY